MAVINSPICNSIADLRELARKRLPRALFEYIDRGSYDERTWSRNRGDFAALELRQRVMLDVSRISVAATVLSEHWKMPVGIAPTGLAGLFHRDGEIQAARAARCPALVLTLDLPNQALRRRDAKNGLAVPPRITPRTSWDVLSHPRWLIGALRSRRRTFGNLQSFFPRRGAATLAEWSNAQLDATTNWKDVAWVRSRWPGKLILKGVLDADDARRACDSGVDALIASNHGGRQLDGGITCGQDVLRALALSARACLVGRACLYGLSALGESGAALALGILRSELAISMALCGVNDARKAGSQMLVQ